MRGVSGTPWETDTTQYGSGKSNLDKTTGYVTTAVAAKVILTCIPEGTKIDTPDGPVAIEDIKAGTKVKGYYKAGFIILYLIIVVKLTVVICTRFIIKGQKIIR